MHCVPSQMTCLLQVVIPGIANSTPGAGAYVPNKVCRTVDEAQNYAAEYVLMSLGMPYDGEFRCHNNLPLM